MFLVCIRLTTRRRSKQVSPHHRQALTGLIRYARLSPSSFINSPPSEMANATHNNIAPPAPLPGLVLPPLPRQRATRRSFDAVSVCFGIMIGVMIGALGTIAMMSRWATLHTQTLSRAAEQLDGFFHDSCEVFGELYLWPEAKSPFYGASTELRSIMRSVCGNSIPGDVAGWGAQAATS